MTPEKINELAQECIDGKWGNGRARKSNLEKAGYEICSDEFEEAGIKHRKMQKKFVYTEEEEKGLE